MNQESGFRYQTFAEPSSRAQPGTVRGKTSVTFARKEFPVQQRRPDGANNCEEHTRSCSGEEGVTKGAQMQRTGAWPDGSAQRAT